MAIANARKEKYTVSGMDCADCALHVEKEVKKIPGIISVSVNAVTGLMEIEQPADKINVSLIQKAVQNAGYQLQSSGTQISFFSLKSESGQEAISRMLTAMRALPGVESVKYYPDRSEVMVSHIQPVGQLLTLIEDQSLDLGLVRTLTGSDKTTRMDIIRLMVSSFLITAGYFLWYISAARIPAIGFLAAGIIAGGYPIARKGFSEARVLQLGMNFLMSVAILGAIILGEWTEAGMVVFLFGLAQYLEKVSLERARKSIGSLVEERPVTARLIEKGITHIVAVEQIKKNQIVAVKPGERIPVDGVVSKGKSSVNQAMITGESMPVAVHQGSIVYAGTLNKNGYLEIQAEGEFLDSTFSKINDLVTEAQARKAPRQLFVERFTRYYTPLVISAAVIVAVIPPLFMARSWEEWIYRALVLLVIACPCAFVISTPVTIISGLTNAFRRGILIKGGLHLERFNEIDVVAFDKTGTLTMGLPEIQKIVPLNNHSKESILTITAALESASNHPLAQTIVVYAEKMKISLPLATEVHEIAGRGISGKIDGEVYIAGNHRLFEEYGWCDSRIHEVLKKIEDENHTAVLTGNQDGLLGIIAITDSLRQTAVAAVSELKKNGIRQTVMLTGDNHRTAESIGRHVHIDAIFAELLPADKLATINNLRAQGKRVAMVGDGVNDAPALAAADIGIAMAVGGSDTALATADIALMDDDLGKLPYLKRLSAKTITVVKQNIFIALVLKFGFLILAIPGLATMWMAVFADMGASLIVLFNGLRILKYK